jgi:hypothetical protein
MGSWCSARNKIMFFSLEAQSRCAALAIELFFRAASGAHFPQKNIILSLRLDSAGGYRPDNGPDGPDFIVNKIMFFCDSSFLGHAKVMFHT